MWVFCQRIQAECLLVVLFIYLTQHCKNWLEKNTKLQIWKPIRSKKLMHDLKLFILMTHKLWRIFMTHTELNLSLLLQNFWNVLTVLNFLRQNDDDIISMTHFQIVHVIDELEKAMGAIQLSQNGLFDRFLHIYWSNRWLRVFFAIFQVFFVTVFR